MVGWLGGGLALLLLGSAPLLAATTFTSSTTISAGYTNYDGTDIVVTNCTLTVDGAHSFSSLLVEAGGVVTHSFAANGTLQYLTNVTNEPQLLVGTNPMALTHSNVNTATVVVTDVSGTILYVNGTDYLLSSPDGIVTDIERTTNSTIADGETVLVSYSAVLSTTPVGLNLTITGNVEVEAGGAINANGIGYGGGYGPGSGHSAGNLASGSGAGYGGLGGSSSNAAGGGTYGSFTQPPSPGSGGGFGYGGVGGAGGGLIQITAVGNFIVDGIICANGANGTNSRSGGGSGGGITLTSGAALIGTGSITANGGNGEPAHSGGGGGGRILLAYVSSEFTGPMTAYGGTGVNIGGAGTVYTTLRGQNGLLVIDNGGQEGTNTPVAVSSSSINVLIQGNAVAVPLGNWTLNNLTVASNGVLLASNAIPNSQSTAVNLTAYGDITIEAGGGIVVDGAGYGGVDSQGAGHGYNEPPYYPCGGGGYGGAGANGNPTNGYGGVTYGNQLEPTALGSGGGSITPYSYGGAGGGGIEIYCYSGFIAVDGRISANGNNGTGVGGGGGSGGSIWINGGTLLGTGSITANGGNGADGIGGGGGGGRIQIAPTANMFEGSVSAYGGGGAGWGGAGTVLLQGLSKNPQLVLDNNGHAGTNTPLQSASGTDLIVQGGAVGSASTSVSFGNLVLNSNGWLTPYFFEAGTADTFNFTFNGNATVQAGAGIIADLTGYAAGQGPGEGRSYQVGSSNYCSGAGHGGYGGGSFGGYAGGGAVYDSITQPSQAGSGGGIIQGGSIGGAGGGVIRLTVTGALELDGVISANGGNGIGFGGGGGSGGSIWLAVGALAGGGSIAASGGNGADSLGGGGGGGMIYIPCNYNGFAGTISAAGGTGANAGGAGQVLIQVSGQTGQLILDNGGQSGSTTPLNVAGVNVTLEGGAIAALGNSALTLGSVLIESNAWIQITNGVANLSFSSATIQPGGGIIADRAGYGAGTGPGAGHYYEQSITNYPCTGAGHGGYGANVLGVSQASGGTPYDSTTLPTQMGSGGGSESLYAVGGAGGGGLEITVTGVLENDGLISANGGNGYGLGGGGGAGGSIQLKAATLSGGGAILANGGNGVASTGGGGAGGCIAVYPTANLFAGTIAAYGGAGVAWGGAGTVYIQPGSPAVPQLILDNAGNYGAATPIQAVSSYGAIVLRNGAVGFQESAPQTCASLSISSNAWLTALPGSGVILPNGEGSPGLVSMTITGSVTIQAGGGIVTDSVGSPAGSGTGAGHYAYDIPDYPCSGGGYGGYGGGSALNAALGGLAYKGTASPAILGSGGGSDSPYSLGGAGGGSVRLTINGTLDDEGMISANGGNGSGLGGGGGSGGSVWLTLGTLIGGGAIQANGGSGVDSVGGGGGGGRISLTFSNDAFTGPITAYGGSGANWGGAGTVYIKTNSQPYAWVIMDNGGHRGTNTTFDASTVDLLIANGAIGQWSSSYGPIENLFIRSNSTLTFAASIASQIVAVEVNATIDPGGAISADGTGYGPGLGTGAGVSSTAGVCGGGGHGGYGAANPSGYGGAYGSITSPITAGSGGGDGSGQVNPPYGGAGGGAVHLEVTETLTMNGKISAAGGNGSADSGGGAGGSLWISAGSLIGSGVISANGGSGSDLGAGGAGGRISVGNLSNSQLSPGALNFSGTMTAAGGGGYANGGAGTIYMAGPAVVQLPPLPPPPLGGQLLVDNGGVAGTNTPVSTALGAPSTSFNLIIQNGAVVCPQTNGTFPTLYNLTVGLGGQLIGLPGPSTLDVLVLSNAEVAANGSIVVDGMGYAQGQGPGEGTIRNGYGSGAGYGGTGGASEGGPGGAAYGSAQQPVDFGSGGGFGQGPLAGGSTGGGALRLSVAGILTMDGQVSAEGSAALQGSAGGGSGGSLWVTAGTLAGTGLFAADGGTGDFYGGGGGGAGGRIALYASVNDFSGQLSTLGAGGHSSGANGTTVSSSTILPLQIVSSSPSGIVSNGVSFVDLYFNDALNPNTVGGFSLTTPSGPYSNYVTYSMISSAHCRASFPLQSAGGSYVFTVATNYFTDLYGHHLAQAYTGSFTILLPQLLGAVTDTNGHPVAGVLLQTTTGLSPATTDATGHYALSFLPGTNFTVQPSLAGMVFVPSAIGYTNVTVPTANQNYLAISSVAPTLRTALNGANLTLSWTAISNVTYQVYSSIDLIYWAPYGNPVTCPLAPTP
jgi:hypothetical protein